MLGLCFVLIYLDRYSFVVFNGKQQRGYKKNKGTLTLGLQLQSLTARALNDSNYVLMASLDLSAAFDVVNTNILLIIGLPSDVIKLIEVWLSD